MREVTLEEAICRPRLNLGQLPREQLESMAAAGEEALEVHRVLAKTGDNVVGELLRGHGTFYEWDHYPPGDVYDAETHSQYYYHAHAADQRFEGEHGHFHTFLRPKGMPEGVEPAAVDDYRPPEDPNDALSHLIAIAMDKQGLPFRLFTVNRWVTAETWYRAVDVERMLERFAVGHARPSWPTNRWITAMLHLFRPQIIELLRARDRSIEVWRRKHPERNVFEDRELEVTSYADISLEDQVRAVTEALQARG